MGFLLLLVAIVFGIPIIFIGAIYGFIYNLVTLKWIGGFKRMDKIAGSVAYVIDVLGNVVGQDMLNQLFLTKESTHKFGSGDESISAVLGYNKRTNTLSNGGRFMARFLNMIDPNHVEKAAHWEDND
jgi:hypothetical protein